MAEDDDEALRRARGRIGTTLRDKYRLDRVVGVGGMATVYAATHRNGKEVAVKLLHPEVAMNADLVRRFVREGYVANAVKHKGAVDVLDDDVTEEGTPFLVMEMLHGETLEAMSERGRVPADTVAAYAIQALDVLAAAHAHGVVHRDIKPANLFLTTEGQIKVLDFGIARLRDIASTAVTHTGAMLGTPAFMSPEQASGKTTAVGPRTDLWALGATMFTLASGALVHDGDNVHQVLLRAATAPARSLSVALPGAPAPFVAVVDRALAFEPAARWPSAIEMRGALEACLPRARAPSSLSQPDLSEPIALPPEATPPAGTARMPNAPLAPAGRSGSGTELITAQPVVATARPARAESRPSSPPSRLVLATVGPFVVVVAAGLATVVATRHWGRPSAPTPSGTASSAPPASADPPRVEPPTSASASPPVPSALGSASAAPSAAPPVPPPERPSRVDPPPSVPPARPSSSAGPVSPPKGASSACSPPYYFDAGQKIWKRECL